MLVGPLFFWARARYVSTDREDSRMFYSAFAVYSLLVLLSWTYCGIRANVVPKDDMMALYIIVILVSVMGPIGGYFLKKFAIGNS
jgi:hypothetical protein